MIPGQKSDAGMKLKEERPKIFLDEPDTQEKPHDAIMTLVSMLEEQEYNKMTPRRCLE